MPFGFFWRKFVKNFLAEAPEKIFGVGDSGTPTHHWRSGDISPNPQSNPQVNVSKGLHFILIQSHMAFLAGACSPHTQTTNFAKKKTCIWGYPGSQNSCNSWQAISFWLDRHGITGRGIALLSFPAGGSSIIPMPNNSWALPQHLGFMGLGGSSKSP